MEDRLLTIVEPVVSGMGLKIVNLKSWTKRERLHLSLTLHKQDGVTLKDCAEVYKTLLPRISVHTDATDPHLEISSPGVGRVLKNAREFGVFSGDPVLILVRGNEDWIEGTIESVSAEAVTLKVNGESRVYDYADIVKAKLC